MKRVRMFAVGLVMSVTMQVWGADALTEALQKGLFEEEANQNLEAAIKAYQDVLGRAEEQRRVAATALFRLAECYRKQGKTNEATTEYRRLVRDYTDQSTLVNLSRQNLLGLGVNTTVASATAPKNGDALTTDEEQQEIQRIRNLIKNSPDLINAKTRVTGSPKALGTVLHEAAYKGHLVVADYLLKNGAEVNALDSHNQTPLYHAARHGHKRMVEMLLAKGAQASLGHFLPLHAVAELGFIAVAEVLLANKADVNAERQGKTALHLAIEKGNLQVAELLLRNGADIDANYTMMPRTPVNWLGNLGLQNGTPLHFAAQNQSADAARLLLANEAKVNARNSAGLTPLHHAAAGSSDAAVQIVKTLLEAGAEVDAAGTDDGGLPGWTPLHIAVYHKRPEIAALLLEKGANPNLLLPQTRKPSAERTVLDMAVNASATKIVELLLKHKADADARDHNGDTSLVRAIRNRNESIVESLLTRGADANALDAQGYPPLQVALGRWSSASNQSDSGFGFAAPQPQVYGGFPKPLAGTADVQGIVELLLEYKADPNQRDTVPDKENETALHRACRERIHAAVELLLKYKADPDARTDLGSTPLHYAVAAKAEGLVDLLLAHNADVKAAKNDGDTALHYAAGLGLTNIVAKLVQRGADVNACTRYGVTPLRRAISAPRSIGQRSEFAAIEFLLKAGADLLKRCDNSYSAFEDAVLQEMHSGSGNQRLIDFFRKHHPKKLAAATFDGAVVKPVLSWEADKTITLSEAIDAVGLKETADLTRASIGRGSTVSFHNLVAIREKRTEDVSLKHGDRIHVPERTD